MTISSQFTVHRYIGDGIQSAWPVLFTFLKPEHVKAIKTSAEGVDTSLLYGSEYTVEALDGGGGRCTATLARDEKITLFLDVPLTQETDLRNAGKLSAEVIERMSDKLTLALQQQRDDIKRCVQVSPSSDSSPQQVMKDLNDSAVLAKNAKDELVTIKQETLQLKQESAIEAEKAKTVVSDAVKLVSDAQKLITSAQALIKEGMGGSSAPAADELLSGMVLPFKGTVNSDGHPVNRMTGQVDANYALCDGQTYTASDGVSITTPDLRDKFIVGAGHNYAQGATGGADLVKLTIAEMPAHSHVIRAYDSRGPFTFDDLMASNRTTTAERSTYETGGSQAHENRPPYYALAYMMKL